MREAMGFGGNCYNVGQVGHGKSECKHAKRVNGVDKGVQDEEDVVECGRNQGGRSHRRPREPQ